MSSSADARRSRRVLRGTPAERLAIASVAAPRGTVVHLEGGQQGEAGGGPSLEEQLAAARQAGCAAGREEALADAFLQLESERAASLRAMAANLAEASRLAARERRALVDEVVGEAVDLAFELLEVLLGHELASDESPIRSAVARAVALVPEGEDLRVRIHPETPLDPAELAAMAGPGAVSVFSDPAVERNGCVVEAGACRIDAQIGPALERVRSLLEGVRARDEEPVLE